MSFKLEITSLNGAIVLTSYVAGEPGSGLEPGDPHFTNKVFAHSLLKPGGALALEDLQLKELVFPLKLHAASKTALYELVQKLNVIINTQGAQVVWQDEGASRPTYFDLVSGQFDDEFDYHKGTQNWLVGKLRLFSQPLGYLLQTGPRPLYLGSQATTSAIGTTPITIFNASGPLAGDAPAVVQCQLTSKSVATYSLAAFSLLPSSEYAPYLPIATIGNALFETFVRASQVPYGTSARWVRGAEAEVYPGPEPVAEWAALPTPERYNYVGDQRLLMLARIPTANGIPVALRASPESEFHGLGGHVSRFGVAATVATSAWTFYDMGILRSASADQYFGQLYRWTVFMEGASGMIELAGAVQLPDQSTVWINSLAAGRGGASAAALAGNKIHFDGLANRIAYGQTLTPPTEGAIVEDHNVTAFARGAIPVVPAKATAPVFAGMLVQAFGVLPDATSTHTMNAELKCNIQVLERTRFAFG